MECREVSERWAHFEDPAEAKGYAQISNVVMRDGSLSMEAKYLYGLLKSFAWQDPDTYPGIKTLCEAAGVSNHTLGKYLKELVAGELVEVKRRGQGKTNLYTFKKLGRRYGQEGQTSSRPEMNTGSQQEMQTGSHNEEAVNEEAVNNSPRGSTATGSSTKDRITLLVDRCREMDFEPTRTQKDTWSKELAAKSRRNLPAREFMLLVNHIVSAAADGYYWSFSRAERELGTPRGKTSMAESPDASSATPPEIIEYVFANTRTQAIKDNEPRIRRVLSRFDFSSGESPPFPIQAELGGTDNERWQMMDALNAICKRAARETRGAA